MRVQFKFNEGQFNRSMNGVRRKAYTAFRQGTKKVFQDVMKSVIFFTPKQPTPPEQKYQRTNRLVRGWGPAARFADVPIPASGTGRDEGRIIKRSTNEEIFFSAVNRVPYALPVEEVGPAIAFTGGRPVFEEDGGVRMVDKTIRRLDPDEGGFDTFKIRIGDEWARLVSG